MPSTLPHSPRDAWGAPVLSARVKDSSGCSFFSVGLNEFGEGNRRWRCCPVLLGCLDAFSSPSCDAPAVLADTLTAYRVVQF